LSEPFGQSGVADQSEAYGNDGRPEDAARDPLQDLGKGNKRETGPKAKNQSTEGDGYHTGSDKHPFCAHDIKEFAARHLTRQAGDAADAQDKSDVAGRPPASRQICRGNRSESRLHSRQEEIEPA
jgi:hypothetical protein